MSYTVFEAYDNAAMFRFMESRLKWCGFKDSSWHNDLCPSLSRELPNGDWIQVFIDYRNPDLKDIPDAPEFSVVWHEQEMARGFDCPSAAAKLAVYLATTLGRA